jgi:hypothetical protein
LPVELLHYNPETGELTPMTEEQLKEIPRLRIEHLEFFLNHVKEEKKLVSTQSTQKTFYSSESYNTTNTIPFPVLLEKLQKFPKLYKGKKYTF